MPIPGVALKLEKFRRRFGIAAPKVIVRSHLGWHWYAIGLAALALVVGTVVWLIAQRGEAWQLQQENLELRKQFADARSELERFRASAGTEQNVVQMERVTQKQLLSRIGVLETENAALKEDISLFERLVPADGNESEVRIERLQVTPDMEEGRYRYRLLLGFQPSKQVREFKGRLRLVVRFMEGNKEKVLALPSDQGTGGEFAVDVKNFLRKEGGFAIPSGAKLKSVEARLLQGETIKAKRLAES